MAIAASSTTTGTHCHDSMPWGSCHLWYASYSANRPPTVNSTIETTKP